MQTWNHFQARTVEELYDPNLMLNNYHNSSSIKNEVLRVTHIGLLCTQEAPSLRPSMSRVLVMLTKKDEELPVPTSPPFIDEKTMELNDTYGDRYYFPHTRSSDSVATISVSSFHPRWMWPTSHLFPCLSACTQHRPVENPEKEDPGMRSQLEWVRHPSTRNMQAFDFVV